MRLSQWVRCFDARMQIFSLVKCLPTTKLSWPKQFVTVPRHIYYATDQRDFNCLDKLTSGGIAITFVLLRFLKGRQWTGKGWKHINKFNYWRWVPSLYPQWKPWKIGTLQLFFCTTLLSQFYQKVASVCGIELLTADLIRGLSLFLGGWILFDRRERESEHTPSFSDEKCVAWRALLQIVCKQLLLLSFLVWRLFQAEKTWWWALVKIKRDPSNGNACTFF